MFPNYRDFTMHPPLIFIDYTNYEIMHENVYRKYIIFLCEAMQTGVEVT